MLSKLVSMSMCMYLSTSIRNKLLVLLSSLSSTSSLFLSMTLSSSISMDVSIGIVIGIGIIYLEAGPSGRTMPERPKLGWIYNTFNQTHAQHETDPHICTISK